MSDPEPLKLSNLSIFETVKKVLNLDRSYDAFDLDVILHINSAFATLHQIGVGPKECYSIDGYEEKWNDFTTKSYLNDVRSYVVDFVKLRFDPPPNSFGISAVQERLKEATWRLNVAAEGGGN